ncbi:heptahelical transmembrane protein 4 isoform X1 [Cajanus cajan]|uniref:heptahelical transmembrane protein 4 isoform X1 n=1 Tax=Cajanus cajan TaxID=3821 RepID=UPI0010FB169C|nr:heptahelical transmembrane protein 4 isoform X1 [Cajanus cajan]
MPDRDTIFRYHLIIFFRDSSLQFCLFLFPSANTQILEMIRGAYEGLIATPEKFNDFIDGEDERVSSKLRKGVRLWRKLKYQLVEYNSLPAYLKDNEFILGYYRSEWPLKQIFLSIFSIHNETLNVWTHLIGFFLFLFLTIYTAMRAPMVADFNSVQHLSEMIGKADLNKIRLELLKCVPSLPNMHDLLKLNDLTTSLHSLDFSSLSGWTFVELLTNCLPEQFSLNGLKDVTMVSPLVVQPITRWPFYAFLGGAMFCLLASSTCHLLACHSQRLSYIMLRIDYAGIAALIATSFYPPVYYSFMCNPFFCFLYLGFITLMGIATIIFSLLPFFQKSEFRKYRASLFFLMGFSGVAPIIHKLILHKNQPEALQTTGYEILMGVLYALGAIIYVTRIPERWMPGKFDIAGHSHQLFHVLVVAGAYTHYRDGLIYLRWRDSQGC